MVRALSESGDCRATRCLVADGAERQGVLADASVVHVIRIGTVPVPSGVTNTYVLPTSGVVSGSLRVGQGGEGLLKGGLVIESPFVRCRLNSLLGDRSAGRRPRNRLSKRDLSSCVVSIAMFRAMASH